MKIIAASEHRPVEGLNDDELLELSKRGSKLVDKIDFQSQKFTTGYFIGLSRITNSKALIVSPKFDSESETVDYLMMLNVGLSQTLTTEDFGELFFINSEEPTIKIKTNQDLITPLMVLTFLKTLQTIVKKGLKKGYHRITENLTSRIKGKLVVSKTIKNHLRTNNPLLNTCNYEVHDIDIQENQILKKALTFCSRYLGSSQLNSELFSDLFNAILPAFQAVKGDFDVRRNSRFRPDPFYPEYVNAINLAYQIFQRFGYNLNSIDVNKEEIEVPEFWINMPKIFELYVLKKLRDHFGSRNILHEPKANYGYPDYLNVHPDHVQILDAKYKKGYLDQDYVIEDIRQLSGYGRDKGVLSILKVDEADQNTTVLNSVIIYANLNGLDDFSGFENATIPIEQFTNFYKVGVKIPIVGESEKLS